jgi:hypothetical protein
LGVVVSYEAIFNKRPWSDRLRAAAPFVGMSLLYVVFYKCMGFGSAGSDAYSDPFSQPKDFFLLFIPKTLSLMGAFVLGIPGILRMTPETETASNVLGASGLLLLSTGVFLCWSRFTTAQKRTVKWLLLLGVFGLFPGVAGAVMTQGREFVLSGLAVLGIASLSLTTLFAVEGPFRKRALPRTVGVMLFAGTLVLSPLSRVGMGALTYLHAELSRKMGASNTGCEKGSHVVVMSGDFEVPIAFAPHLIAALQGRFFESWHQLAVTKAPITVARPGASRLILSSESPLVNTMLLREKDNPLVVGDIVERQPLEIEILETTDEGPTKIGVTFRSQEIVADLCVLKTEKAVLKPAALPAVGQSTIVAYQPFFE